MYKTYLVVSRATYLLGTTSVNNCLVLLFAATSLTSDRVMSPNGSFSTAVNTFVLEWGQGVVLRWGRGGNSKLCAFLKRGRNSTYLWGLHRWRGRCVFKIWMSRLPERTRKTSMFSFYATSYSRVSQIKVNEGNQNRGDKCKSNRRYLV